MKRLESRRRPMVTRGVGRLGIKTSEREPKTSMDAAPELGKSRSRVMLNRGCGHGGGVLGSATHDVGRRGAEAGGTGRRSGLRALFRSGPWEVSEPASLPSNRRSVREKSHRLCIRVRAMWSHRCLSPKRWGRLYGEVEALARHRRQGEGSPNQRPLCLPHRRGPIARTESA